jgi:hypothetical protein
MKNDEIEKKSPFFVAFSNQFHCILNTREKRFENTLDMQINSSTKSVV